MSSGIVESSQSGSSQQQQQQQGQPLSRMKLVQRLLAASANLPNFIHDLIMTQAQLVAGTEAAAFLIEPGQDKDPFTLKPVAHIRPDESDEKTRSAALLAFQEIIKPCIEQGKDGAIQIEGSNDGSDTQYCLITLLRSEGNVVAAGAVVTRAHDLERAKQRLESMALVAGYFELFTLRRTSEQSRSIAQSHQHVLQLATAVATADGFESAAMNLCNELATRTQAARVSIGWLKGNHIKLKAISHTEQFDKKQELSVQLVKVMEECMDNDEIVQYEPDGTTTSTVTREAQSLSRSQSGETILSLPLRHKGEVVGVMTLEFAPNQKIGPQAATGLAVAADLLAPQLYDRYQNDRWLITKTALSTRDLGEKIVGPKHMLAKSIIVLVFLVLAFVTFFQPMYHVTAPFQFVPIEKQTLSVPFENAVLKEVNVRPGDTVKKDQVVLVFDTYELKLNRDKALAEAQSADVEATRYAEDKDKSAERQMAVYKRDAQQAEANFLTSQISKAQLKARFDGEVLTGDLLDKRDGVFKQGEPLMEIGQPNVLKAELHVAERDIQDVSIGAKGFLSTHTLPGKKFPFTVDRIVPEGKPMEDANVFTVYVTLNESSDQWRPMLEGEAKIEVGERRLGWIRIHRFSDWLHFHWWTLW